MSGYLSEVMRIALTLEPGTVNVVTVLHDDWCSYFKGTGRCDCSPEIIVRQGGPHDIIGESV